MDVGTSFRVAICCFKRAAVSGLTYGLRSANFSLSYLRGLLERKGCGPRDFFRSPTNTFELAPFSLLVWLACNFCVGLIPLPVSNIRVWVSVSTIWACGVMLKVFVTALLTFLDARGLSVSGSNSSGRLHKAIVPCRPGGDVTRGNGR